MSERQQHFADDLAGRVEIADHLRTAHDYRFDVDRGALDPVSEFGHNWRDADGRWITPTSEYLAIHRELHALAMGERKAAMK